MLLGVMAALAASASWAAANVFIQRSGRALGPFRALVWAQLAGALGAAAPALLFDQRPGSFDAAAWGWAAVGAVAAVLGYTSLFFSAAGGRLSVVVPVMSSWSVVAAAVSLGVLGETVRRSQLAGAALVVAGVLVVSRFSQQGAAPNGHGDGAGQRPHADGRGAGRSGADGGDRSERRALLVAPGATIGFGVLIPAIDRLAPAAGRIGAVALVFLLELALVVPLFAMRGLPMRPPPRAAWPAVLGAGLFETAGFVWISVGLSQAPVTVVSPLASLSMALTVLAAWLVLGERPPALVLAGAALACAGVVTLSL